MNRVKQSLFVLFISFFVLLGLSCSTGEEQNTTTTPKESTAQEKEFSYSVSAPKLTIHVPDLELTIIDTNSTEALLAQQLAKKTYLNALNKWFSWRSGQGLLDQTNNALGQGHIMTLSPLDIDHLKFLQYLSAKSGSKFNPAIGKTQELWSFFQYPDGNLAIDPPNTKNLNQFASYHSKMNDLRFNKGGVYSNNKHSQIELSTTIEGYLVEQIYQQWLVNPTIQWAKINVGQTKKIFNPNKNRAYPIIFPIKKEQKESLFFTINLCHGDAITTINKNSKIIQYKEKTYHHIINPKTARPAETPLQSITVLSSNAIQAQAAINAAFIANQQWQHTLKDMNVKFLLAINKQAEVSTNETIKAQQANHNCKSL